MGRKSVWTGRPKERCSCCCRASNSIRLLRSLVTVIAVCVVIWNSMPVRIQFFGVNFVCVNKEYFHVQVYKIL
jgi:hypothetical protein